MSGLKAQSWSEPSCLTFHHANMRWTTAVICKSSSINLQVPFLGRPDIKYFKDFTFSPRMFEAKNAKYCRVHRVLHGLNPIDMDYLKY